MSIPDAYDAAKDAHDSYYAAIEAKRLTRICGVLNNGDLYQWPVVE